VAKKNLCRISGYESFRTKLTDTVNQAGDLLIESTALNQELARLKLMLSQKRLSVLA
jgi:hypothetical protein